MILKAMREFKQQVMAHLLKLKTQLLTTSLDITSLDITALDITAKLGLTVITEY
jgi:hypothetical protein